MAVAGDIIIKLAADFAEFSKAMTDSAKTLDDFGKKADGISGQITAAFKAFEQAAAVALLAKAINSVIEEVDKLQKKFTDIAEQAKTLGVGFDQFEALRIAAIKSGTGVDALVSTMTKLKGVTDQALQGNAAVIDSLNKLGITILDNTGKVKSQDQINQQIAQTFERMPSGIAKLRAEFSLLGEAGADTDKKLRLLAGGVDTTSKSAQALQVADAVEKLKAIEDRSAAAAEKFQLLAAALTLPLKAEGLTGWATGMERLNAAIVANDYTKLSNILRLLFSPMEQLKLAGSVLSGADPISDKIKDLEDKAASYESRVNAATAPGASWVDRFGNNVDALREKAADARVEIGRLKATQTDTYPPEGAVTMPPVTVAGSNPSKVTTGGGGGRSGPTDAETIDAMIARYGKMREAAEAAQTTIRTNTSADINDLSLIVEARQAAQDAVAKIGQTKVIAPGQEEALEQSIFLAKQAQAEQQRSIKYAQDAEAVERTLGDGTRAHNKALSDLNHEFATGRLSVDAYNRSLVQQSEATSQAALQAKRYDDDIGSLFAGFQNAAQQYGRANDLYSSGEQVFTGLTGAMGQALDVLGGTSTKTFNQIATDFALMLAKMAAQAALSSIFKMVFGSAVGSITMSAPSFLSTPQSNAVWGSMGLTPRASGGAVDSGQSYWVGEYGPERFVPQAAGRIEPAGGSDVTVNVANYSTAQVSTQSKKTAGGRTQIDVIVEAVESRMAGRLSRGQGSLGSTLQGSFGLQRVGK
jgi:hypothetical protein